MQAKWPYLRNGLLAVLALEIASRFVVGSLLLRLWGLQALLPGPCRPGVEALVAYFGSQPRGRAFPIAAFLLDNWIDVSKRNGRCSIFVSSIKDTMAWGGVLDGTMRCEYPLGSSEPVWCGWR